MPRQFGERLWNQCLIILLGRPGCRDRQLYRERLPSRFRQFCAQRVDHIDPVRVCAPAVQNDRATQQFLRCRLGVYREKHQLPALQSERIAGQDGILQFQCNALLSRQIGSRRRCRQQHQHYYRNRISHFFPFNPTAVPAPAPPQCLHAACDFKQRKSAGNRLSRPNLNRYR